MKTKAMCKPVLIGFLILLLAAPPVAFGQSSGTAGAFSQEELDQMLAPIALYPDSLLAQILVASTYPLEVVEADRWVKGNKNLKGDQLNDALDKTSWDLIVKALVPFPDILSAMSEKLDWTQKLGDAFLAQESEVMGTIQKLRGKARAQGNLQDTEQQKVIVQGDAIEIQPANPTVVYVPTYNPTVVYGAWAYPSYPPYYFNPVGATVAAGVLGFAAGVAVGSAWNSGWGHWNWGGGNFNANVNRNVNINRNNINVANIQTSNWQHDAAHRKGVAYRDQGTRDRFAQKGVGSADARRDYRGFSQDGKGRAPGDSGRPGGGQLADRRPAERPGAGAGSRPDAASTMQGLQSNKPGGGAGDRLAGGGSSLKDTQAGRPGVGSGTRPGGDASVKGAQPARPGPGAGNRTGGDASLKADRQRPSGGQGAFEGMGNGKEAKMSADRGRASRQQSSPALGGQGGGGNRAALGGGGGGGGARAAGGAGRAGGGGGGGGGGRGRRN
jgi:hypothetical protein